MIHFVISCTDSKVPARMRSKGVIVISSACGIALGAAEIFGSESCTQVYTFILALIIMMQATVRHSMFYPLFVLYDD